MTNNSDTQKQHILKPGKTILVALLTALLIASCASSPKQEQEIDPAQESANIKFEQAREAYREFNYEKTTSLLNEMADQGDANAQYALGYMYYYGFGVVHDEAIALEWIKKAAASGQADAVIALDRVRVSAKSVQATNERNEAINKAKAANTGPDQHARLVMQAEAIIAEETAQPSPQQVPEVIPEQSAPDMNEQDTETKTENSSTEQTTATSPTTLAESADTTTSTTPGQDWILRQNPDHYTIQVISGKNEKRLKQYMKKNGLTTQSTLFELQRDDLPTVYIGVHGVYPTLSEARLALQALPTEVQEAQPWIRSFKSIQATLR